MRLALTTILVLGCALPARAADWCSLDTSTFSFETSFEGEALPGEFPEFAVRYSQATQLKVTVDLAAADMGDPDMNDVLADPAWFGSEMFPEAVFESDAIAANDDGAFVATGTLDLKGVRQSVAVPFTWSESGDSASMRGELTLQRTDFDVGSGEWSTGESIGLDVRLVFHIGLAPCD